MIPSRLPSSIFGAVLCFSQRRPVFTADYYAVDTGSNKVASFIDWNDPTHLLAQGNSTNQVLLPTAHADFGGQVCATFLGTLSPALYTSNRPASTWAFAHLKEGSTALITLTSTITQSGDFGGTSASTTPGIRFNTSVSSTIQGVIANDIGVSIIIAPQGAVTTNVPSFWTFGWCPTNYPNAQLYTGSTLSSSPATSNTVGVGTPGSPFVLGQRPSGGVAYTAFRWANLAFFPGQAHAALNDVIRSFSAQRYGLTS